MYGMTAASNGRLAGLLGLVRRSSAFVCVALLASCAPAAAAGPPPAGPQPPSSEALRDEWIDALSAEPPLSDTPVEAVAEDSGPGKDFAEEARLLFRVAACGSDDPLPEGIDAKVVKAHCDEILPKIASYKRRYVGVAKPFLTGLLPAGLPDKVVYPFGGGDLVTALTTYPDAHEITTVSLELTGDPRRIHGMGREVLEQSLSRLRRQLSELYFIDDYSRSETLKRTQRGDIPGELAFFLVGLSIHGYEPVSLRYFTLGPEGAIHYLSEREIAEREHSLAKKQKSTWWPPDFSESFANAEIAFRPIGAPADAPVRIHRHIAQNLSDEALERNPALIRHLDQKGPVAAIVKAASYLLWLDAFSDIRGYLLGHAVFMVSDSTGIPASLAARAGFVQETYGRFTGSLLPASGAYNREFRKLWRSQPRRRLPFRYGYLSQKEAHLLVTKKSAQ
jgi:hypothetical protein